MNELRAASIKDYLKSVNKLFVERGYDPPIDFSLKHEAPALYYENVRLWETEPNRRTHLSPEFLSELFARAKKDTDGLGFVSSMKDFTILGRYTGIRLSEYGQTTQKKAAYHKLPTGRKILKAFRRGDFLFLDKKGKKVVDPVLDSTLVHTVTITWRVQKNRRNGQKISWIRDYTHSLLCPVLAALRIYERSLKLGLSDSQPMGAYRDKTDVKYITGSKIALLFKSIAMDIYPDITKAELSKFSAHMIRVSAAVLLQIAEKPAHFIKMRLRWESETYRMYLRNTSVIAMKHLEANVSANLAEKAYNLANVGDTTPDVPTQLSIEDMGNYDEAEI